jgi:hypothetical protein
MSSERRWFIARANFQATVHGRKADVRPLTDDLLFLVQAVDHPTAVDRAAIIAREKEHSYDNERGQRVSWALIRIVEVTEMIDQRFEDGAELKSTMSDADSEFGGVER